MKQIICSIEGIVPILQHKMSVETETQLGSVTKKQQGQGKQDDVESFLYLVDKTVCQPSEHIVQAIIKQASNYKIQGKGKKTYKDLCKGAISIFPDMIEHENQNWVVDSRTVVIPATKGRKIRLRPKIEKWALKDFTIQLLNDSIPIDVVKGCLDDAGREGGIGDYRPRFGRFIVTKFLVT